MQNKLDDLDFWLNANPKHPDYNQKIHEKKQLELNLINHE
jgi:hypothetical protein